MEYSFFFKAHVGNKADALAFLKDEAEKAVRKYPQYRGHFDAYELGRMKKTVVTKMGVAAAKGDLVLFKREAMTLDPAKGPEDRAVFWSRSNQCDTVVKPRDVEAV